MTALKQAGLGLRLASFVFAAVAVAHGARWWLGWEARIGAYDVGLNVSAAAAFITAGLSLWLWKLAVKLDRPAPGAVPGDRARAPSPSETADMRCD